MTVPISVWLSVPFLEKKSLQNWERALALGDWALPADEDRPIASEGELRLRFWIDNSCTYLPDVSDDVLNNYSEIEVARINVEVSGIDVSDAFADVIIKMSSETNFLPEHIAATYDPKLIDEYNALGYSVFSAVIKHFNRFVSYVRAVKGQYWLQQYPTGGDFRSNLITLRARVKLKDFDWLRLTTTGMSVYKVPAWFRGREIVRDDWKGIHDHLAGQRKAPLVGQLLAGADEFRDSGHTRAALTEAVSALEVAVSQFAHRASPESWTTTFAGRSSAENFESHVQHLGTTCTVGYLLPVLFSEEQIPQATLKLCHDAIIERNAVIHTGKREVVEERLQAFLDAIRDLCGRLRQLETTAE